MSAEIIIVLSILAVTIFLIVTELFRIDVVAILAMLTLAWIQVITPKQALSGFSSNAILAIIGVMIMGRGLARAGVTDRIANFILRIAGKSEPQILTTVCGTVGVMSGLMQNLGAAALFLPVMSGISKREKIPISNLLMPMGYTALLGGTLSMVGTSSLIVLNDLLENRGLETFGLFDVTHIGVILVITGLCYFFLLGNYVLPSSKLQGDHEPRDTLINVWGLSDTIYSYEIQPDSDLIGKTVEESRMGSSYGINLLKIVDRDGEEYNFWDDFTFQAFQKVVIQGREDEISRYAEDYDLDLNKENLQLQPDSDRGNIEVVIPARSNLVGHTIQEISFRETYKAQILLYFSNSEVIDEDLGEREIQAGDTMILHGNWENLRHFKESEDFIPVSPFKEEEQKEPEKAWLSGGLFAGAIGLVFLSGFPISIGFLTGAIAMILTGVLHIEEAYRSIEWKVVFLISGLIPIGIAMQESGTASLIASNLVKLVKDLHPLLTCFVIGALTTVLSLVMSNVAATVLLVPLVLEISGAVGVNPHALVLLVGVCAANSFVLPTHHVNALLMTPGGYRVKDYIKAGGGLSILFLLVSVPMIYFTFG